MIHLVDSAVSDNEELTEEEIAAFRKEAEKDIAKAKEMVTLFSTGFRQFEFFNPSENEVEQVATLCQAISDFTGEGGAILVAAVAILKVAELDQSPLVKITDE